MDHQQIYKTKYERNIGNIRDIGIQFRGSGSVDYVRLQKHDNKIVCEENFDDCKEK